MTDYGAMYEQFDANGDQKVTVHELKAVLRSSGHSDKDIICGFCGVDKNNDQIITKDEFVTEMSKKGRRVCFNDCFDEYDIDGNGKLSKDELKEVCKGQGLSDDQIENLLRQWDTDGDGKINKMEFLAAV